MDSVLANRLDNSVPVLDSLKLESNRDLYTSLLKVKINADVTENKDGSLNLSVKIMDIYDFNPIHATTYKGNLTRTPAKWAYSDQEKGYLSNYDINIFSR